MSGLLLACCFWSNLPASAQSESAVSVDFARDIRPILARHCYDCHGPMKQSGGLQLDRKEFAEAGGSTGLPIVGGTLETNELLRRVSSDDASFRMPRGAESLSAAEIGLIRNWVRQGTPWPQPARPSDDNVTDLGFWQKLQIAAGDAAEWLKPQDVDFRSVQPLLYVGLIIICFYLLSRRMRSSAGTKAGDSPSEQRRWRDWLLCVRERHYAAALLLLLAVGVMVVLRGQNQALAAQNANLKQRVGELLGKLTVLENPIRSWTTLRKPRRPSHPKQLSGNYYRGNCERDPELFNNGNYLTASFRIALCDARKEVLQVNDIVMPGKLYVRFDLERAPHATTKLYTQAIIDAISLSKRTSRSKPTSLKDSSLKLNVLEEEQHWSAYFPIADVPELATTESTGLFYVNYHGRAHYGIQYDVKIEAGRIAAESELWMGCMSVRGAVNVPPPNWIPFCEWFDYRPLPVIVGKNTDNPRLLGIEEHLEQTKP
jgi:mono/diheme cytochrome c family protein